MPNRLTMQHAREILAAWDECQADAVGEEDEHDIAEQAMDLLREIATDIQHDLGEDAWGRPLMQPGDGHGAWACNNYECTEHPEHLYGREDK